MKMKIRILLACALAMLLPFQLSAAQDTEPKLIIDEPVYVFDQVPEGEHVSHVFVLKNTGDTVIRITKVQPP